MNSQPVWVQWVEFYLVDPLAMQQIKSHFKSHPEDRSAIQRALFNSHYAELVQLLPVVDRATREYNPESCPTCRLYLICREIVGGVKQ
jgi:hypothetical protein